MAAVRFLIDGGDDAAAKLLLMSELEMWEGVDDSFGFGLPTIRVTLYGPRALHDALEGKWGQVAASPAKTAIETALKAVADPTGWLN